MNINSKEFVTIAQEIHTKEISTKDKIENKRTEVDQFHDTLESIRDHISYLEAARDAVEDSDEKESYKNKHIERLEAEILEAEMEELKAAKQLRAAENELFNKERDLESVLDEKAQTLFQVRERARKESDNSKTAGKMYGSVYSDIGASLQNHIQMNLMSLSQAASILDGSVEEFVESVGDSSNEVNLAGNGASISNSKDDFLTSPLSAFTLETGTDSSLNEKRLSASITSRKLVNVLRTQNNKPSQLAKEFKDFGVDGISNIVNELTVHEKQNLADKAARDYNTKTNPYQRALDKGIEGVKKTPNGGVSFAETDKIFINDDGARCIVKIQATGNRTKDFDAANKAMELEETPDGFVWHHVDDYNVEDGTITLELVEDEAHNASKPHSGGCAQYDAVNGPNYNPPRKGEIHNV